MKRLPSNLARRLDAHFVACTAAVGAAAAFSPAPEAKGAIIFSGPVNINVPSTTSGIYLNFVTGLSATTPGGSPGWDFNPWGSGSIFFWTPATGGAIVGFAGGSSTTLTDNLPFGTLVNGSATFGNQASSETTGSTAFLLNSTNNYVGISFLNEATGLTNFGWVQLSLSTAFNAQPRSIIAFAFDNTGAGITVGAVPEPSTYATLGLMALGALGVRLWKRAARAA